MCGSIQSWKKSSQQRPIDTEESGLPVPYI